MKGTVQNYLGNGLVWHFEDISFNKIYSSVSPEKVINCYTKKKLIKKVEIMQNKIVKKVETAKVVTAQRNKIHLFVNKKNIYIVKL